MAPGSRGGLLAALAGLGLLVGGATASTAGVPATKRPPTELGAVETIAGPEYCSGPARFDPASTDVRALAVGQDATIHIDSGPPDAGLLTKITPNGEPTLLRTGIATAPATRPASPSSGVAAASRLAPDGEGGVLAAAGTRIVQVGPGVATIAGDPTAASNETADTGEDGATGDGGPAEHAEFNRVASLATDAAGNAYIADLLDADQATIAIRAINRSDEALTFYAGAPHQVTLAPGHIDTIAGVDGEPHAGDGGPAADAVLAGHPPALAVSGSRLYIASQREGTSSGQRAGQVRLINLGGAALDAHGGSIPAGGIATIAGRQAEGFVSDTPELGFLPGLAAGEQGTLYLADHDHHRVLALEAGGDVGVLAGSSSRIQGFNGNNRRATEVRLANPYDVAVGPRGRVYVSDHGNSQVRYIDQAGTIHPALGNGLARQYHCQTETGEGDTSWRGEPASVAGTADGHTYFTVSSSTQSAQLKRVEPSGKVTTVTDVDEAPRLDAGPDGRGLYLLGGDRHDIRFVNVTSEPAAVHGVTVAAGETQVIAGDGRAGDGGDGGDARQAQLHHPAGAAVDSAGNLFVADAANHRVRMIAADGSITTLLEPNASRQGRECCLLPLDVAVDEHDNLYVTDAEAHRVWFTNRGSEEVTVHGRTVGPGATVAVAGDGTSGFGGDGGPAIQAQLVRPGGVALGPDGELYVADGGEHVVRKIDTDGTITTAVGTGAPGFNGDGLRGPLTKLDGPTDLDVDHRGNLLIADQDNHRLRRLTLVEPAPQEGSERSEPTPAASGAPPALLTVAGGLALLALAVAITVAVIKSRAR